MGIRTVNGNTFTENGWPLVDQDGCTWITIPGTNPPVTIQVQTGIPATVLGAWEADWNAYIEPLEDATTACWTEGNSVLGGYGQNNGSNHLGGTAADSDWERHPMGPQAPDPAAGFSQAQYDEMQRIKAYYTFTAKDGTVIQLVWWANDWDSPHDSMHSQMGYNTYQYRDEVQDWINTHIGPDGFSTYRRGGTPIGGSTPVTPVSNPVIPVNSDAVTALYNAVPVIDEDRAAQLVDAVVAGLAAAQCNTVPRIAMALAQWGHESAGFSTTQEFGDLSDAAYYPYIGRTWIQITWQSNYQAFGTWCVGQGLLTDPNTFVNNPVSLADLKWAGIGAAWYWTVERPINDLIDAGDAAVWTNDLGTFRGAMSAVTAAINGGQNNIDDRTARYNQAIALGDQLLALLPQPPTDTGGTVDPTDFAQQLADIAADVKEIRAQLNGDGTWPQTGNDANAIAALEALYASGKPMSLLDQVSWLKLHVSTHKTPTVPGS